MPAAVRAFCKFGAWHDIEVEDDVTAYMTFANGASGLFVTSTGEPYGENRLEIMGTHGKLLLADGVLTHTRFDCNERTFCRTCPTGFGMPQKTVREVLRQTDGFDRHTEILRNFTAAVRGEESLLVRGEEGIHGVRLLNAMLLSAWTNEEVGIPFDERQYARLLTERAARSKQKTAAADEIEDNTCSFGGF